MKNLDKILKSILTYPRSILSLFSLRLTSQRRKNRGTCLLEKRSLVWLKRAEKRAKSARYLKLTGCADAHLVSAGTTKSFRC